MLRSLLPSLQLLLVLGAALINMRLAEPHQLPRVWVPWHPTTLCRESRQGQLSFSEADGAAEWEMQDLSLAPPLPIPPCLQ